MIGSKNTEDDMTTDELFIENTESQANVLIPSDEVSANDAFIDSVTGYRGFREACKEIHLYKHIINISVLHIPAQMTEKKIFDIKEKVLAVLDATTVAHSPVYFWVERTEKDGTTRTWHLGKKMPTEIVFKQFDKFSLCVHVDFMKDIISVLRCIIQLNHIVENVRQVTYNSSDCKIGKYFEVGDHYMHITGPQRYVFDWCGLQNEIFKNTEVTDIIRKTQLLGLQLMVLEISPKEKLKESYQRIFNLLVRYNRRKLMKLPL